MAEDVDVITQPVSDVQLNQLIVDWVPYHDVKPNKYNPNRMSWHDRQLLKQSLLEDGWTQPIVTLPDGTIVDGEQRWTTAGAELHPRDVQEIIDKMEARKAKGYDVSDSILSRLYESRRRLEAAMEQGIEPTLAAITGGEIPVTRLNLEDDAHKMISTIRHNRARGTHQVDKMAGIAQDLVQLGLDLDDLETRLGMDDDEIKRFLQSADGMMALAETELAEHEFRQSWKPESVAKLEEDEIAKRELERSRQAAAEAKKYQEQLKQYQARVESETEALIAEYEARGDVLTQDDKDAIEREIIDSLPEPEKPPPPPQLKKLTVFVSVQEYTLVTGLIEELLGDSFATGIVRVCQFAAENKEQLREWLNQ